MRPGAAFAVLLVIVATLLRPVAAGVQDWVTPGAVLDASPHLWYRMAETLVQKLYDPSLKLFRETWGTPEGRCWYWNTEQGEAAQIVVYLNNATLLADMLSAYRQYLTYDNGTHVYLFSRYTPCSMIRVLSTDPANFSLGNLIVNVGGDLAGTRTDNGNYSRVIAVSLDIYKDYSNVYELDKAWPNLWYTVNLKGHEVWYLAPGDTGDYKGIWDTSDGSLGSGRIVSYSVSYGAVGNATRVMSDGRLVYTQGFILEPRKPYVKVLLVVRNNSTDTLSNVRVTLAFDNMDWWLYQVAYLPGIGYINASTDGTQISSNEKEYHLAYSWEGKWQPVNGWWTAIFYSNRPLGMNRGLAVMVNASYGVHLWGYGNLQAPQKDLYGIPAFTDWYFRWMKFEIQIGSLAPGESRTVEVRIVPMASYAPGLEDLYVEMLSRIDQFDGRDFSYAVNTGTGAFKGLAMAKILLAFMRQGDYQFAQRVIDTVGEVMEGWGWRVATRALSNYILALLYLYDYTRDPVYLDRAEAAADLLLSAQIRDPSDPRDGGFLDILYPFGVATYLDVNAEAAHALLALYDRTGNQTYLEAVRYWLDNWFHYDNSAGRWYYYRYKSLQDAPSEYWYKGYLDEKQPYAQGYFLQALAKLYWSDERLLVSANKVWSLLSDEYWVLTWEGANETNVETQGSTAAGLREYLDALTRNIGVGVEYVRGAVLKSITYEEYGSYLSGGLKWTNARVSGALEKPAWAPATVALHFPFGGIQLVYIGGTPAPSVSSLTDLLTVGHDAYYWDNSSRILYLRLYSSEAFSVIYTWANVTERVVVTPRIPGYTIEPPPAWSPGPVNITLPAWLENHKDKVALATIGLALLIATEASAPVFALVAAGLAGVFYATGWLSMPQMAVGLVFAAAGLGVIGMRKRS